jgi:hypothetical protein
MAPQTPTETPVATGTDVAEPAEVAEPAGVASTEPIRLEEPQPARAGGEEGGLRELFWGEDE